MACSSCGRPRVNPSLSTRNTGLASSNTGVASSSRVVESQSLQPRAMKAVVSNPNSAKRTKV